jgi:hypothetical protein
MHKKFICSIIFLATLILCCCSPLLLPPSEKDSEHAKNRWNDISPAQLNMGYTLYKNKCGSCHSLYKPDKFSEEKWLHDIPVMAIKAKLDSSQTNLIIRYILTAKETRSFVKP